MTASYFEVLQKGRQEIPSVKVKAGVKVREPTSIVSPAEEQRGKTWKRFS